MSKLYKQPKIQVPRFSEENGFYTTKKRSDNMARIKGWDTKPEKILKKALWHAGVRYRSNSQKLLGRPDISFIKYKLVVFVDGSFWHGHDWNRRKSSIKSNRDFWLPKIERNMQRDQEVNAYYLSKGWTVLRFWDFEVKNELGVCVMKVAEEIERACGFKV
ncbi:very short patch repair endonuclease [Litoribacter ruber]|uniref:Very short patch repair endonuclease n=1 Tax=Litoribacter ruber TaxID=702568 RepID=A0AAP2G1E0_9BACT|nr:MULTISPECIES: very short patch repair endonuclease [Litoribacter]MBS9524002.1 very short patch repair endonuclease [Litoribacter alkaliphilus]MBT0811414.1 very short patch repair endonuclease [Litoribacter ruber]